ncbi:hypothetical protein CDAR_564921 [Caerostris darwini]|uniref:Uncharacterized protein n=1 Tax=Caerostris darwini TaxID=1538125 RepID=A0AAV4QBX3_9ARAC|nr:hypothetical protein CDAR_564901 [Caerostris darwini]GIY05733.1 hypothetical protein CDAR_564911 [Caerostris darwini]GIY05734.1 hypothetical protein CDAR_564921 [Caerostris darwini]
MLNVTSSMQEKRITSNDHPETACKCHCKTKHRAHPEIDQKRKVLRRKAEVDIERNIKEKKMQAFQKRRNIKLGNLQRNYMSGAHQAHAVQ